jgi:hypothetical protein
MASHTITVEQWRSKDSAVLDMMRDGGVTVVDENGKVVLHASIPGARLDCDDEECKAQLAEATKARDEALATSGLAAPHDSSNMTNTNDLTIKLQLSETREKQATEMCTWLTTENQRLRDALKLSKHLDSEIDELLEDAEDDCASRVTAENERDAAIARADHAERELTRVTEQWAEAAFERNQLRELLAGGGA